MLRDKIIRAWKDPEYRENLSEEERELLPENPAGAIELTDEELDMAAGGSWTRSQGSYSRSYRPSHSNPSHSRPSQSSRSSNSRPSNSGPSNSGSYSSRPSGSWRPSYSRRPSYSNRSR
jgi:mersacidin/lichenicidin family type 2 lantibiotic